ncbi:O-Antigen ligase [Planctomycetes bacterium K23_9]|uniref:O-Antigen ligase n=2 Tax=Stieleria marina TaxID=1930275 RepID=A0A517NNV3_9BACT|nr:O-Antigen ligase [Planctomycetes bacterium K23_9]
MIVVALLVSVLISCASLATRVGWVCAMLAPAWLSRGVGALSIDLRFMTLGLLAVICIGSGRWIKGWNWVDLFVGVLTVVAMISLQRSQLFGPSECLVILSTWVVPYVMGRLVITKLSDLDQLLPYACAVCLVLSTWSVVESTTKVNPLNVIAGRGGSRIAGENYRMNLRRAEGPLGHPIYFGMTIAMLFPWSIEGARQAWNNQLPRLFIVTPILCAAGVFCTLSRGPILVLAVSIGSALFFWKPAWRLPLGILAFAALALMVAAWPIVVDQLESLSGEEQGHTVTINGDEYEYSGTKHRTLLYIVYASAMQDAGWLGHGKWGAKTDHLLYVEPELRRTFRSIDNHYVLLILNWGIAGLIAFLALGLFAIGSSSQLAFVGAPAYRVLIGSMSGTIAAVMLLLLTVWFSNGFGFSWLCYIGMLSSSVSAANKTKHSPRMATHRIASAPPRRKIRANAEPFHQAGHV